MSTTSQSARVLAVLKDGKPHSVPEIHQKVGTMRLNSRVADLRKQGHTIICERVKGKKGAAAYQYQLLSQTDILRKGKQLTLSTDDIAPRVAKERYRIFRVRDGGDPEIVATVGSLGALGKALYKLGLEGEFDDCVLGLQDAMDHRDKDKKWVGKWFVLPWQTQPKDEKATA
jgi:biotin operon repressor